MSTDEPDHRGHHTLVYDIIQTNLGQGYNKNTGVFTVPKAGLYSLTRSTRVGCHLAHTTELVINDRILGSTYAYCGYNTVTGHVVATVSQGDVIFVRTHSTSPGQGAINSNEFGRSAFSGFSNSLYRWLSKFVLRDFNIKLVNSGFLLYFQENGHVY